MAARRSSLPLTICILMMLIIPSSGLHAQGTTTNCPALVETALATVDDACAGLGRDEACYGHTDVEATYWTSSNQTFNAPADRIPAANLHTIATAPLDLAAERWGIAVLHIRANLPDTLPGQAVTFLLMGDAALENAVEPAEASRRRSIEVSIRRALPLYRSPSEDAEVLADLSAGQRVRLTGTTQHASWVEAQTLDGLSGWLPANAVDAEPDILAQLAILGGTGARPTYGPMQAFYFMAGFGAPTCHEAPDGLLVSSPDSVEVALNINQMDISISSTVSFTMIEADTERGPARAMLTTLLHGRLEASINGQVVVLEQPDQAQPQRLPAFAVTLNDAGRVDADSVVITPPLEGAQAAVASVCRTGLGGGVSGVSEGICDAEVVPTEPQGEGTHVGLMWHLMSCVVENPPITNPVSFGWGIGCFDTEGSGLAHPNPALYQLWIDGQPASMDALTMVGPEQQQPICPWGYSYFLPPRNLPPGEHVLTLTQTVIDGWQDESGGHENGEHNAMECVIEVMR